MIAVVIQDIQGVVTIHFVSHLTFDPKNGGYLVAKEFLSGGSISWPLWSVKTTKPVPNLTDLSDPH